MVEHVFPAVAVRQWVVIFAKSLRYFLDRAADCLKRVAGIVRSEVQRATAGASTSTAAAGRSGGDVVWAPLWRDAERTRAFAFVHAGRGGGAGVAGAGVSQG